MGLLPQLRDYSSTNIVHENSIPKIMSRKWFKILLSMFHIIHNGQQRAPDDCLYKILHFLNLLQPKFKESYIPEELVHINESNLSHFMVKYISISLYSIKSTGTESKCSKFVLTGVILHLSKYL